MFTKIKSLVTSKKTENKIRRILELALLITGICTIASADYVSSMAVGLMAVLYAFKGLTEDLPRIGALKSNRKFWG